MNVPDWRERERKRETSVGSNADSNLQWGAFAMSTSLFERECHDEGFVRSRYSESKWEKRSSIATLDWYLPVARQE